MLRRGWLLVVMLVTVVVSLEAVRRPLSFGSRGGVSCPATKLLFSVLALDWIWSPFRLCLCRRLKVRRHVQQERAHRHLHPPGARSNHRALQAKKGAPRVEEEDQVKRGGCSGVLVLGFAQCDSEYMYAHGVFSFILAAVT